MSYERWAVVVMDRGEPERWRTRFLETLAEHDVELSGDELRLAGTWVGNARFEPLGSVGEPLASWIGAGDRPFVGAPARVFVWSHYLADHTQRAAVVCAIAPAAPGAMAH